jgi:hypothetical protein
MYMGRYMICGIPENCPITLLNKNKSQLVKLSGYPSTANFTSSVSNGDVYTFYYGILFIEVYGDFGRMSIYSNRKGYLGGYGLLVYGSQYDNADTYPDPRSVPIFTEIEGDTVFNEIVLSENVYTPLSITNPDNSISLQNLLTLLNNNPSQYSFNLLKVVDGAIRILNASEFTISNGVVTTLSNGSPFYSMTNGVYRLYTPGYSVTIRNSGRNDSIQIQGTDPIVKESLDGNSYQYNATNSFIYVYSDFGYMSIEAMDSNGNVIVGLSTLSYTPP